MSTVHNRSVTAGRRRMCDMLLLAVLALTLASSDVDAEPPRNRILDQLQLAERGGCTVVRVDFTLPIRYVRHFPYDDGNELRIKLDPIAVSAVDRPALAMRESLRPAHPNTLPLYEVVYEGDMDGGPFLTLEFHRAVRFAVRQGRDFRSVVIAVSVDNAKAPRQLCPFDVGPEH